MKQPVKNYSTGDNDLTDAIRKISASTDSRIERMEITGYTSPEGALVLNAQLALKRAACVRIYYRNL